MASTAPTDTQKKTDGRKAANGTTRSAPAARKTAKAAAGTPQRRRRRAANTGYGLNSDTLMLVGKIAAAAATVAGAAFLAWQRLREEDEFDDDFGAAFAKGDGDKHNFDQTRDAGPAAMRDDMEDWDAVDQASDESFPASDPAAKY